jgi:hypothetical protein
MGVDLVGHEEKSAAAPPLGSLTLADAPLIDAENLFRQPEPALFSTKDSATTARTPPGRMSLVMVANRWTARMSKVNHRYGR